MWPRYRKLRNKFTAELRKSVEAYYKSLVDETSKNPKEMWKTVNKVLNKDKARMFPSSVTYNGNNIKKQNEIAEAFNRFTTIGPKLASKIKRTVADDHLQYLPADFSSNVPSFVFKRVDKHLLKRKINKLKCSKSHGHDKIPVKVIKDAVNILAKLSLTAIFNSSMEQGVFSDAWKLAMINPIYKSGQKFELCNYRPISVLSVLSKLFEKIVHDQVSTFLKERMGSSHTASTALDNSTVQSRHSSV